MKRALCLITRSQSVLDGTCGKLGGTLMPLHSNVKPAYIVYYSYMQAKNVALFFLVRECLCISETKQSDLKYALKVIDFINSI